MINYLLSFFSLILFSIGYFSQKTYLAKVDGNAQKYRGRPLFRPYFGIFEVLIEGMIISKNLFGKSSLYLLKYALNTF